MTDKNKTEIIAILDRSGSMAKLRSDMEGGFNSFVADQRKLPGECAVSLYRFDDQYEAVFESVSIHDVPPLELEPRGSTALLDALGRTMRSVGDRLRRTDEDKRPGTVIVLVLTDGQENASKEYGRSTVAAMIEEQQKKYNWQFVYLGAHVSTFAEAATLGVAAVQYNSNSASVRGLYKGVSRAVGSLRSQAFSGQPRAVLDTNTIARAINEAESESGG